MPKFNPSTLLRPISVEEAVSLLKESGSTARLVAGNTTLYEFAHQGGLADVDKLIDIMGLGLSYVREDEVKTLHLGATTTFSTVIDSTFFDVKKSHYALKETCAKITPPQIRNMGTVGGAICCGIPFYDLPVTLLALNAAIKMRGADGETTSGVEDFFIDYFVTAASTDSLVVEVQVPLKAYSGSAFIKLGRTSVDFAVVNTAAMVTLDEKHSLIRDVRIGLGAVSNTPVRAKEAEQFLIGKAVSKETIVEASKRAANFEPTPSVHASSKYKKMVIPVLVRDALLTAVERAGGRPA